MSLVTHLCDHALCSRGQVVRAAAGPGSCPRRRRVRRRRTHRLKKNVSIAFGPSPPFSSRYRSPSVALLRWSRGEREPASPKRAGGRRERAPSWKSRRERAEGGNCNSESFGLFPFFLFQFVLFYSHRLFPPPNDAGKSLLLNPTPSSPKAPLEEPAAAAAEAACEAAAAAEAALARCLAASVRSM